jgi:hypothetical protein
MNGEVGIADRKRNSKTIRIHIREIAGKSNVDLLEKLGSGFGKGSQHGVKDSFARFPIYRSGITTIHQAWHFWCVFEAHGEPNWDSISGGWRKRAFKGKLVDVREDMLQNKNRGETQGIIE